MDSCSAISATGECRTGNSFKVASIAIVQLCMYSRVSGICGVSICRFFEYRCTENRGEGVGDGKAKKRREEGGNGAAADGGGGVTSEAPSPYRHPRKRVRGTAREE